MVYRALSKPLEVLANNSGKPGSTLRDQVAESMSDSECGWIGWDASGGKIRDLREGAAPVLDPCGVAVGALEAAVSVAVTLLTVEGAVTLA